MPSLKRIPWRLSHGEGSLITSWLRKTSIRMTHGHATVRFGAGVHVGRGFHLWLPEAGTLEIGPGSHVRNNVVIEISGQGKVTVGAGTVLSYGAVIQCTTEVTIGDGCAIAAHCLIADGSHRFRDPEVPIAQQGYNYRPVHIDDDTFIMAGSVVVASVGPHAMVAANSVVNRDLPGYCLAGGSPAVVLEHFRDEPVP